MININNNTIELKLTSPRSKVRICDENGNHQNRPTSAVVDFDNDYIEWMITNQQLNQIIFQLFTDDSIRNLRHQLHGINLSLLNSEYSSREAQKQDLNNRIGGFSVYRYEEIFYSFEKNVNTNLKVKITFKFGDYTLAAHMFVLIDFNNPNIKLENNQGIIVNHNPLGSGAKCFWNPSQQDVVEVAKALAHSSIGHKNDLIRLLEL